MAPELYQEGDPLPRRGDIQAFVEHTMLNTLSEDERHALDRMVLFPRPTTEKAPGNECVAELMNERCARWSDENTRCEVQHLVRNVCRTMLSEGSLRALHEEAVVHWKQHVDDPAYAVLLLYHKLALDNDDLAEVMEDEFNGWLLLRVRRWPPSLSERRHAAPRMNNCSIGPVGLPRNASNTLTLRSH